MARFSNAEYIGPPRGYSNSGSSKHYIAIHNTSNNATPKAEAGYAKTRTDKVSSHFYADHLTVIQSLDTRYDAWHAGSSKGNKQAIAFELVGSNSWSEAYWRKVIDRVAPVIAAVCKQHDIPVKWAGPNDSAGFVTHDDMRRYWGGTTHTDPGPNFPRAYLLEAVNKCLGKPPRTPAPSKPVVKWPALGTRTLKQGCKGNDVKELQRALNAHGAKLTVDGDFGPRTESAVKAFQRSHKLTVDGKVGPQTRAALRK